MSADYNAYRCDVCKKYFDETGPAKGAVLDAANIMYPVLKAVPSSGAIRVKKLVLCKIHADQVRGFIRSLYNNVPV